MSEIVIPMEEAAQYARKRALYILITSVLLYLLIGSGLKSMIHYIGNYASGLVYGFSLSFEYLVAIFSPVIDLFSLFDYPIAFIMALLVGIFLHELLHGLPAAIFSKNGFKSVNYGVYWKYLTPYTHCKEPLELRKYKTVLLTPGIILGIIPEIIGIIIQNFDTLMFGVVFTIGALGDLMVFERVKGMNNNILVKDHPESMGLIFID